MNNTLGPSLHCCWVSRVSISCRLPNCHGHASLDRISRGQHRHRAASRIHHLLQTPTTTKRCHGSKSLSMKESPPSWLMMKLQKATLSCMYAARDVFAGHEGCNMMQQSGRLPSLSIFHGCRCQTARFLAGRAMAQKTAKASRAASQKHLCLLGKSRATSRSSTFPHRLTASSSVQAGWASTRTQCSKPFVLHVVENQNPKPR